jgi:CRISPR-associated protein Cmr2
MKYEFHAHYSLALKDSVTQAKAIDWLVGRAEQILPGWREVIEIEDPWQRISLLAQALPTAYKDQARVGTRGQAGGLKYWVEHQAAQFLQAHHRLLSTLALTPTLPDLSIFPSGTWGLQFTFTLRKPYISRDDTDFHILDNPVKKEWVFKVPYVAPTQWKGALRAAMVHGLAEWWLALSQDQRVERSNRKRFVAQRLQLARLFGNEKDVLVDDRRFETYLDDLGGKHLSLWYRRALRRLYSASSFLAGRLHFYPTYFDCIGLEVINPHPRDTGAGSLPIYFECVPHGTQGTFTLLYVPLDGGNKEEAQKDLQLIAEGIRAMMTQCGFGAKTSSGYGVADVDWQNATIKPSSLKGLWQTTWKEST